MARGINRLPASYKTLKPGMHCDGGNLYLQVTERAEGNRRRSWIFRYVLKGHKARDMGLGSLDTVTLAEARETAREYRNLVRQGIDPIGHRDSQIARNLAADIAVVTFDQAADSYIKQHRAGWTNRVHAAQWSSTLRDYVSPVIGRMSVADITTAHVMRVLEPIWTTKPETASRVRARIEKVLSWATTSKYRSGDNPARWRNHLDNLLAAPSKLRKVEHQPALPYAEMPAFMAELRQRKGMAALALEFAILTCVRTGDVRFARWADVDLAARTWTIAAMTKTAKERRVPLSTAAVAVFDASRKMAGGIGGRVSASAFAFPNDVTGARLSETALRAVLRRMGRLGTMTTHGCRSSFRTWAQEQTNFPWELAEMSLGHVVGTAVERAYARGDALKKRVAIMQAWADYLGRPQQPGKVIPIQGRSA